MRLRSAMTVMKLTSKLCAFPLPFVKFVNRFCTHMFSLTYFTVVLQTTAFVFLLQAARFIVESHFKLRNRFIVFNFVETCGSCYAFSSMAMHEARMRVMTNMSENPVFSTQDIVECCQYSQGTYLYVSMYLFIFLHVVIVVQFTCI